LLLLRPCLSELCRPTSAKSARHEAPDCALPRQKLRPPRSTNNIPPSHACSAGPTPDGTARACTTPVLQKETKTMIETIERRGQTVSVDSSHGLGRFDQGLCGQCGMFKMDAPAENCSIANKFLRIGREENLTAIIFACPQFESRELSCAASVHLGTPEHAYSSTC
jgi:hypothetical protein